MSSQLHSAAVIRVVCFRHSLGELLRLVAHTDRPPLGPYAPDITLYAPQVKGAERERVLSMPGHLANAWAGVAAGDAGRSEGQLLKIERRCPIEDRHAGRVVPCRTRVELSWQRAQKLLGLVTLDGGTRLREGLGRSWTLDETQIERLVANVDRLALSPGGSADAEAALDAAAVLTARRGGSPPAMH